MDKEFEAKVKGMYSGGGCACQTGVLELKKKHPSKNWYAKTVAEYSKQIKKTDYCFKCRKQIKN